MSPILFVSIKCQAAINKIAVIYVKLGKLWNKLLEQLTSLTKYPMGAAFDESKINKTQYLVTSLFDKTFAFESKIVTKRTYVGYGATTLALP